MRGLGGSGRIEEITQTVIEAEGLAEEQQTVRRRPAASMGAIEYRLAWFGAG